MALTPQQIKEMRAKYGIPPEGYGKDAAPVKTAEQRFEELFGTQEIPTEHVEPSFKASVGGAGTILPNIAKTIGNIPSDAASVVEKAVIDPAKKIQKSEKLIGDIYKDRGAVEGTKDIVKGTGETLSNIFQAPGKAFVNARDNTDVLNALSPIQEAHIKQRDDILKKIQDFKKEGKDTTNLVKALKYTIESLDGIDKQIGSKEDRRNKEIADYTKVLKYPIEHPVETAIVADTLNPEAQAGISNKIKPVTSKIEEGVNLVKDTSQKVVNKFKPETIDAVKATEKTMTKSERLQAINEGRQVTTKLGGVDYLPSKVEQRAAELLDGKLTKNPVKNVPIVKKEIAMRGAEAEAYLAKNPVKISAQEQADMFAKTRKAAEKNLTETELKAYDEQMKLFLKQLPGRGGYNTENFYKGLKDYESNIADHLPRGKEALLDPTGVASAKIRAASDIRTVVRDAIGERHPEFKPKMFDLASLYEAKGNIIAKAEKLKGNMITRTLKNPIVKYGVGGTALFEGAKKLTGN